MLPLLELGLLLALSLIVAPSALAAPGLEGQVVWVDDGDTIDVHLGDRVERVRYIGIDAPEIEHHGVGGAPGGLDAARANAALVAGQRVRLELDAEVRDRYGRLLAYVWVGGRLVNAELVRAGYARALVIPPNLRYTRLFRALEREARAAQRGMWANAGSSVQTPASVRLPRVLATTHRSGSTGAAEARHDHARPRARARRSLARQARPVPRMPGAGCPRSGPVTSFVSGH